MKHASLIDEWLEEAVEQKVEQAVKEAVKEAVAEAETKAIERGIAQGKAEGIRENSIVNILRGLRIHFGISEEVAETVESKLAQIQDLAQLDELVERALRAFTLAEFLAYLEMLLTQQHRNGSRNGKQASH